MQDASSRRGGQRRAAREVSIKGSSVPKPTPVIVANLVKGTSPEDVRLTFDALGRLVYVRLSSVRMHRLHAKSSMVSSRMAAFSR